MGQIIYDPDGSWSAWKRLAFRRLYLPLFRFFDKRFNFFPPHRKEPDGTYSWLAVQGCFLNEAEAQADAARYPFGYVVPDVPLGNSKTADCNPEDSTAYYPNRQDLPMPPADLTPFFEEVGKLRATVNKVLTI